MSRPRDAAPAPPPPGARCDRSGARPGAVRLGERGLPTPGRTQGSKPVRSGKGPQGALKGIKQVTRRSAAAATTSWQRTRAPGVHFCRDARGRLALRECAPGRRGRPVLHRGPGSHLRPRALGTPGRTRPLSLPNPRHLLVWRNDAQTLRVGLATWVRLFVNQAIWSEAVALQNISTILLRGFGNG